MNVAGLRQRIRNRTASDDSDQSLPPNMILDFINEANYEIGMEHDWPWRMASTTFPTVAGTKAYTQPATYLKTRTLKIAANRPFAERTLLDLEQTFYDDQVRGQPTDFALEGTNILLGPVPDAVYTVTHRYLIVEPALTLDTSIPLMPEMFQTAIVELGASLAFRHLGNSEQAAMCVAAYEKWLAKMQDKVRQSRSPMHVLVRADSGWGQVS